MSSDNTDLVQYLTLMYATSISPSSEVYNVHLGQQAIMSMLLQVVSYRSFLPGTILLIQILIIALVFYEYAITIDQEITTVWKKKVTATSVLLITTRWVMLVNTILQLLSGTAQVVTMR